jgi:hypothetical protein
MKKTMRNSILASAAMLLALPVVASAAQGIVGDCVDCHTMHNSEEGANVAQHYDPTTGTYAIEEEPIQNLLRMDCISCHANPSATGKLLTLSGGSVVPQVSQPTDDNLAGGNFRYSSADDIKGHNVIDLTPASGHNASQMEGGSAIYGAPPGMAHASHHGMTSGVFSVDAAFDAFTCAGARGCHGTRSQALSGGTVDNGTANNWEFVRRTGISAISGAHHNSHDGAKTSTGYPTDTPSVHDGAVVADGYRFIPGLEGYGNEAARWQNVDSASHNEYYADNGTGFSQGCADCHQEGHGDLNGDGTPDNAGPSSRAALDSYLKVPGNDMTGFCSTCHGQFHSSGNNGNGTSGAFLRHPSDWVIPNSGEYAAYTTYNLTAPVGRPAVPTASSSTVTPGTDEVMCLSCHQAHATPYDFMLRFDYRDDVTSTSKMIAGGYADITAATAEGGCLACHTTKVVLPENR